MALRLVLAVICLTALILLAATPARSQVAQIVPTLTLSEPSPTNGKAWLRFTGEVEVAYVVLQSTNLQDWYPVATNSDPEFLKVYETLLGGDVGYFRVARPPIPLFSRAVTALERVVLSSTLGIGTDSFNSTNPLFSTSGLYDSTKALANGDIACVQPIVDLHGAKIRGYLATGPQGTNNFIVLGNNGLVGDWEWSGPGIQPGHYRSNFNVYLPDVMLPSYAWSPPTITNLNQSVDGTNYQYAFGNSGDYLVNGISGRIYVGSNAIVRLYVSGDATGGVLIEQGGELTVYMGGESCTFGDGVVNRNMSARSFQYFGLPSNTSLSLGWRSNGGALVYAPQADLTITAGTTLSHLYGAMVSKSLRVTGRWQCHFDESLVSAGPQR